MLVEDIKVPVNAQDKDGVTPLMSAADYACDAAVKVGERMFLHGLHGLTGAPVCVAPSVQVYITRRVCLR